MKPVIRTAATAVAVTGLGVAVATGSGVASADPSSNSDCPVLFALGVQGTGETTPGAAPNDNTGMLSDVFGPFMADSAAAGVDVKHENTPYDASFGGFTLTGGTASYQQSVTNATSKLSQRISDIAKQCPATKFALAGYSQGAHAVSMLAQQEGQGHGPVPAQRIAAVALFGDPTRNPGAAPFPGADGRTSPEAAPGLQGKEIAALAHVTPAALSGGGIGPERDIATNFGTLTGRVASFCAGGDLACDAPDHAALLRAVANVAGQADFGGDPLRALGSITQSLALTGIKTVTNVVNKDVSGNSLASLSLNPRKSISERIAEASDPRTPLDPGQVMQAAFKVATIGINSAVTVARAILTPTNIAEIAAAGLTDPIAGLAVFGTKLLGALPQLIPPSTGSRLIQQTFNAVVQNLTDNQDMLQAATWVKYSDVIQRHGSYQHDPVTDNGQSATRYVADWFTATAKDLAASGAAEVPAPRNGVPASPTPVPPTTGFRFPLTDSGSTGTASSNSLGDLGLPGTGSDRSN
ncbi:cutinase family protein [Nocardia africana]|uniref:cutinase family protein n=1 Tax=Nocardia africana TaxID=134964 RepID=UPI0007A47331